MEKVNNKTFSKLESITNTIVKKIISTKKYIEDKITSVTKKENNDKSINNKKNNNKKVINQNQSENKVKNKQPKIKKENKQSDNTKTSVLKNLNSRKTSKKEVEKINYKDLTVSEIEKELKREKYKSKYVKVLTSTIYALIIVAASAALIATLVMPVLQISGSSMTPTFNEGEIILALKSKNIETGDIIAFYHGNKILVKRVIAGAGNWVNITEDGKVYINGELLNEPYIEELSQGDYDIELPYQVPDGHYFVLGDHRSISIDSRSSEIGSIQQENIVGKIVFRVWPLNKFGKIN